MLLTLSLRNFVIVEQLELNFDNGFTVLTGETGTGKSIILNALGLLLGDKADFSQIRNGANEAQLSALFSLEKLVNVKQILHEQGFLDLDDDELSIRRIIDAKGKSRHFINAQACTLAQLKAIGELLLDIHGQNAHHSLNSPNTQRQILDTYAGATEQRKKVSLAYQQWQAAQNELDRALDDGQSLAEEQDRLSWQQQELSQLSPQENEWETLSLSYDSLAHAADLLQAAVAVENTIDSEQGLLNLVMQSQKQLADLSHLSPEFYESLDLLYSIETELNEISTNMRHVNSKIEIDPTELAQQESRMQQLSSMAKKYRLNPEELPHKWAEIQQQLQQLTAKQDISILEAKVAQYQSIYQQEAQQLSKLRQQGALRMSSEVSDIMHTLAMERAQFQVTINADKPSSHGNESITYQVAMNSGSELKPLNKVASGGELARISLAIQMVTSSHTTVPTLIFDEVDTGIGGRVAEVVGRALKSLGKQFQVLSITHLPQVAAFGQQHYQVQKRVTDGVSISEITVLDREQQIQELARMLGGETITQATLTHASEMKNHSCPIS